MASRSAEYKKHDREIDFAFRATCSNIPLKLTDIPKVFAHGHQLLRAGADRDTLRNGIHAFVVQLASETT